MSVLKEVLEELRNKEKVEIARENIKWHGKLANAILNDMITLACDLPEGASAKKALGFIAKRIAPKAVETVTEYNSWVKSIHSQTPASIKENEEEFCDINESFPADEYSIEKYNL